MIRVMVSGLDELAGRELTSRLRGAVVEIGSAPPEDCAAAVFVGTEQPEHRLIEYWLSAGKHVLVAAEAGPSRQLLEAVSAHRGAGTLAVINPDRYLPSRQLLRQQLDAGRLGEVGLVRVHRWESAGDHRAEPLGLTVPLLRDLDLVCWLFGRQPDRVYAVGQPERCFVQVHLGFPGGGMALVDYSGGLPAGDGYQSVTVIGSTGAAYADDHQNMQLVYRGGRPQAVRTEEAARQLATLVQEFVDALQAGRDPAGSVTPWCQLGNAVVRSLETHQAVDREGH
jgi:predicted dehydrogenase